MNTDPPVFSESEGWDHLAQFYFEFRNEDGNFYKQDRARLGEAPYMKNLLSQFHLQGKRVLDAGCGFGYYGMFAAEAGAIVTGVDFSQEMISIAREQARVRSLSISYYLADVSNLSSFENETFDIIVSGMDLDVPDLTLVFKEFWRILALNGYFIFSVPHPIFMHGYWLEPKDNISPKFILHNYFRHGPYISEWQNEHNEKIKFRQFLYTLQDYSMALSKSSFVISRLLEGEPISISSVEDPILYKELQQIPMFLIIQAQKILQPL